MIRSLRDRVRRFWAPGIALAAAIVAAQPAASAELYNQGDLSVRWDNTLRYTLSARTESPSPNLLADPNADDGDRNFRSGLITDRLDLFSTLDVIRGGFGAEVSAAGWYDAAYSGRNDNNSPSTFNPVSVPYDEFTAATRRLMERHVDLLNAFVRGAFTADDMPVTVRLGRSAGLWGESLFFASNGIAAGQAPIDDIKALSVPSARAQEVFLPVAQANVTVQPSSRLVVEAYYQFEWRKDRLPPSGSYFSTADYLDAGGERVLVGSGDFFSRGADQNAPASGQFGAALHLTGGSGDFGLYALRYNAKDPQIYLRLGPYQTPVMEIAAASVDRATTLLREASYYGLSPNVIGTGGTGPLSLIYPFYAQPNGSVGTYNLVFPRGIEIYGASFSGYLADSEIAGEISARRHMPLVSQALIVPPNMPADAGRFALYPTGDTLQGQISDQAMLPPSRWWQGANFAVEVAFNDRLDVTSNPTEVDPSRSRFAMAARATFEPQYFAVLPGLDLTLPLSLGLGVAGKSSVDASQNAGVGDVEIGVAAVYRAVWEGGLTFTHYFGSTALQPFADRDFISLYLQRTF